jgi:hypothetical protein
VGEEVLQEQEDRYPRTPLSEALRLRDRPSEDAERPPEVAQQFDRRAAENKFYEQANSTQGQVRTALSQMAPQLSAAEIEKKRSERSWLSKYVLGGTHWGSIKILGNIPFVNPLKTIWSGLEWTQENIASPATGAFVGGTTMGIDAVIKGRRVGDYAQEFRSALKDRPSGISGFWKAAGDFNQTRGSLYPGEKFVNSMIFDPTTYVGLGWLKSAPVVGKTGLNLITGTGKVTKYVPQRIARYKTVPNTGQVVEAGKGPQFVKRTGVELSLGALDSGFRQVTDMPFRALSKLARQIPKTRAGKARVEGNQAEEVARIALQTAGGTLKRLTNVDPLDVVKVLTEAIEVAKVPTRTLTKQVRALRVLLYTDAIIDSVDAGSLAERLGSVRGRRVGKIATEIEGMSDSQILRFHQYNAKQLLGDVQAIGLKRTITAADIGFEDILLHPPKDKATAVRQLKQQIKLPEAEVAARYKRHYTNKGVQGLTDGERLHLTNLFQNAAMGRESLDRVSEEVVTLFNAVPSADNIRIVKTDLEKYVAQKLNTLRGLITRSQGSPKKVVRELRRSAENRELANFENGDTIIGMYRQGLMGAMVSRLDDVQLRLYQKGLRRYVTRPMAAAVLMFPGFPIQNALEDIFRQVQGLSSIGWRTNAEFFRATTYWENLPPGLVSEVRAAVTRADVIKDPDGFSFIELADDVLLKYIDKVPGGVKAVSNALNPVFYQRISGDISTALRRHFFVKRGYIRMMEILEREHPDLIGIIDDAPKDFLFGRHMTRLQEDLVWASMTGDHNAVRALIEDYAVDSIKPKEINKLISDFMSDESFAMNSRDRLYNWAESGGAVGAPGNRLAEGSGAPWQMTPAEYRESLRTQDVPTELSETPIFHSTDVEGLSLGDLRLRQPKSVIFAGGNWKGIYFGSKAADIGTNIIEARISPHANVIDDVDIPDTISDILYTKGGGTAATKAAREAGIDVIIRRPMRTKGGWPTPDPVTYEIIPGAEIPEIIVLNPKVLTKGTQELAIDRAITSGYDIPEKVLREFPELSAKAAAAKKVPALDRLKESIIEEEWKDFRAGPHGTAASLERAVEAVRRVDPSDLNAMETMMYQLQYLLDQTNRRIEGLSQATMHEITQNPRLNRRAKSQLFEENFNKIEEVMVEIRAKKKSLIAAVEEKELLMYQGTQDQTSKFAEVFRADLNALEKAWATDLKLRRTHFGGSSTRIRGNTVVFWDEYYKKRSAHWEQVMEERFGTAGGDAQTTQSMADRWEGARSALKQHMGDNPNAAPVINPKNFGDKVLTLPDISYIIGGQSENISQAILGFEFHSKKEFVDYVVRRGKRWGHTGINADDVGNLYEAVLETIGMSSRTMNAFSQKKRRLETFFTQLKSAAKTPKYGQVNADEVEAFINRVADKIEVKPQNMRTRMKSLGQAAVDGAHEDLKQAYVNYDDTTSVDDFLQGIFPFWKYEASRLPYLLRTSIQTPAAWSTIMPEGRYWEATGDGYVSAPFVPWMEMNYFGGTIFNTPRRMFRAEYPPQHETGLIGHYSKAEENLARLGFYAGPHITFANEFFFKGGKGERGDVLPPPISAGLSLLEMSPIKKIADNAKRMRNQLFPDRFRRYLVSNILAEWNHNPSEVDWDTLTPKPGSKYLTETVILDAVNLAAQQEFVQESAGMVRFRPPALKNYRDAQNEIYSDYTGLSKSDIEAYRRDGVHPAQIKPVSGPIARLLHQLPNADLYKAGTMNLQSEERQRQSDTTRQYHQESGAERDRVTAEQVSDNKSWFEGKMAPNVWNDNLAKRRQSHGEFFLKNRGRGRDPETGDVVEVNPQHRFFDVPVSFDDFAKLVSERGEEMPIQHPFDIWIEGYYNIVPKDLDGDGVPEWDDYFSNLEFYLEEVVPNEIKEAFLNELDRSGTPPEKILRQLKRGILGDYWAVSNDVLDELGPEVKSAVQEYRREIYADPDMEDALRRDSRVKLWRETVRDRRSQMRMGNAQLDYALNIFGFTGTQGLNFENPTAKGWWKQDGNKPSLAHF